MKHRGIAIFLSLCLIICLFPMTASAALPSTIRTLTLTENWNLTEELNLTVPADEAIVIDGGGRYYIYEMSTEATLINTGAGIVRFKDTMLYHAGNAPQTGTLAELMAEAAGITSIGAPAKGGTSITPPAITGYDVSIKSSSRSDIIALNGTVTPPSRTTTVNLVLTLAGSGGEADTRSIAVTVPGTSSGGSHGSGPTVPAPAAVSSERLEIPANFFANPAAGGTTTLTSNVGTITVPSNMLQVIPGIEGKKAEIVIGQGDKENLSDDVKAAIGNRPLIQISLTLDGTQTNWNNPDAPVTVSIPYTPTTEELANPESIVIWYIDGSGNVVSVPNGSYDAATGKITFSTTHFSNYAVAYNKVSFSDVAAEAWYNKAISFIAARDITTGTGGGNFSPDAKLTRGQFLVMLMKAYEMAPDAVSEAGNFADAGNTYYTGYLSAAKRLGISAGIGNNMFAPEREITRQEMFTLLYNALKEINRLPAGTAGKSLSNFGDAGEVASWATEAMTLLTVTGTITGSNGMLAPANTTTRAEMAQVLYNLLSQ